jgi:hypothetical protein
MCQVCGSAVRLASLETPFVGESQALLTCSEGCRKSLERRRLSDEIERSAIQSTVAAAAAYPQLAEAAIAAHHDFEYRRLAR